MAWGLDSQIIGFLGGASSTSDYSILQAYGRSPNNAAPFLVRSCYTFPEATCQFVKPRWDLAFRV